MELLWGNMLTNGVTEQSSWLEPTPLCIFPQHPEQKGHLTVLEWRVLPTATLASHSMVTCY